MALSQTSSSDSRKSLTASPVDRLIVALDVPKVDDALRAVDALDNVTFFKIGLQLFLTGGFPTLLEALKSKKVFVDLKVPGDIGNTVAAVVDQCVSAGVVFLTLSESMPPAAIRAAKAAREKSGSALPKLLTVPFLSSLDAADLQEITGGTDVETHIASRARVALDAGCDGVIASGDAIRICRDRFPEIVIVSPGVRPAGSSTDDHKRLTTPTDALRMGADCLVVGRPILRSANPKEAASRILDEIAAAVA